MGVRLSTFVKYGLIFSAFPLVATYVIGHFFKAVFLPSIKGMTNINDPDRISVPIIEFVFPFALLSGVIAFCFWVLLMRRDPSTKKGLIAGLATVFAIYPIIGFAIGYVYPDLGGRFRSGVVAAISLSLFGNFVTFWITYPLAAILGRLIGKRFLESLEPKSLHIFD